MCWSKFLKVKEQDVGFDTQYQSGDEYDYEWLDEVLELEDESLLADDSEGEDPFQFLVYEE